MAINPSITLRDYRDAAALYSANKQLYMPKLARWFHIYFEIDSSAISTVTASLASAVNNGSIHWIPATTSNYGLLGVFAKEVNLPTFSFAVQKKNQYNRASLNVTKIEYKPVSMSFHDDALSTVTDFWYGYYQYMIQDPKYAVYGAQTQGVPVPAQWQPSNSEFSSLYNTVDDFNSKFGMDTQLAGQTNFGRTAPFFRSIRIYQFSRANTGPDSGQPNTTSMGANYDEFVLVNPIISNFEHAKLNYSSDDSTDNSMTIEYETVLYNKGYIKDLASWSAIQDVQLIDTTPSPLGTNQTTSIPYPQNINSIISSTIASQAATLNPAVSVLSNNPTVGSKVVPSNQNINKQISVPGA